MRSILAKQEQYNSSTQAQNFSDLIQQSKILSEIAGIEKMTSTKIQKVLDAMSEDKKILLASLMESAKMDKDTKVEDKKLLDITVELKKILGKSDSNLLKLYEEAKKHTESLTSLKKANASDITNLALKQNKNVGIGERLSNFKDNFFSVKGFLNTTGIVKENSSGFFARAIDNRHARKEYINDQRMMGSTKSDSELSSDFKQQQKITSQLRSTSSKIDALREKGYDNAAIEKTGLLETQRNLASQYAKVDPRAAAIEQENTSKFFGGEEVQAEEERAQDQQLDLFAEISKNTAETNEILLNGQKKDKEEKDKEKSDGGIFGKLGAIFGSFLGSFGKIFSSVIGAMGGIVGTVAKLLAGIAGAAGSGLLSAAGAAGKAAVGVAGAGAKAVMTAGKAALPYALPAAVAVGAGNALDYGIGKLGVGKDEEGKDLAVDVKRDEANWNRMNIFQKAESGLARGVEKVGSFIGLDNLSKQAQATRIKTETEYLDKRNMQPAQSKDAGMVYSASAETTAMREKGATTSAPVIVAPSTVNNSNTQVNRYELPVRKNDDSLNRYTGSKLAY
jgi:hypothetical protein